jgi:hypothetical protein
MALDLSKITHNLIASLLALLLLSSCALKKDNKPQNPTSVNFEEVASKMQLYCLLSKEKYDAKGYVHDQCDGLLFTALHGIACDYVSLDEFQKEAGLWKRSPTHDCFVKKKSRSGLSRDMLLGLILYAWHHDRVDYMTDLIAYGEANDWDMCGGEWEDNNIRMGRCVVSPTLKATIYEVATKMGFGCGATCRAARAVPQVWDPKVSGFEAHLVQLHILVRWMAQGAINDNQTAQLAYQAKKNPSNALFLVTDALWRNGDMSQAWEILQGPLFPADRLPESSERCTDYLWQRDAGADWSPCPERAEKYDGTDLAFVAKIILGELRGQDGYTKLR